MQSPQPNAGQPYYAYSMPLIGTLSGAYLLLWLLILVSGGAIATGVIGVLNVSLFYAVLATVALLDWRGLLSLRGLINWSTIHGGRRVLFICLYIFGFAIALGIYLVRALLETRRAGAVAPPLANAAAPAVSVTSTAQSFKARLRTTRGGFATLGVVFAFMLVFYGIGSAAASADTTASGQNQTASNPGSGQNQIVATSTVRPIATLVPTATPTVVPTATATPKPCASPCNPWGYNFSKGSYIYDPPSDFCSYFDCIDNFWNGRGYVMECQDGMYSKSGGISGSCSHHSGNLRPLYSH